MPRNFNDSFAVLVVLAIFGTWAYVLTQGIDQAGVIVGATILALGQITQYYWRKRPPDTPEPPRPEVPHG